MDNRIWRSSGLGVALLALGVAASLPGAAEASQCGQASWYAMGKVTANGEAMNANALAAAHRTLPFGTRVRVENVANGRSVTVRINDRGPFVGGRVIDLTRGAAAQIGMIEAGVAEVRLTVVEGKAQLSGCT